MKSAVEVVHVLSVTSANETGSLPICYIQVPFHAFGFSSNNSKLT